MDILLYSANGLGMKIEQAIRAAIPKAPLKKCYTIGQLRELLRTSLTLSHLILLVPRSQDDLSSIITLADWLVDSPLILVLPDSDKATVSKGLKLRPRFYTFADGDLDQMVILLARLLNSEKEKQNRWTMPYQSGGSDGI